VDNSPETQKEKKKKKKQPLIGYAAFGKP